ncbi:MAG: hypothetical protein LQ350_006780 [Teloschistes chrysophthalmus]|nr:MAG: hypothetical protein LQ350_006780 [Niorma chrysophthalma]
MSQCCISGFAWDAKPQGKEDKLGNIDAYITDTPENKNIAIMIIADIFGWTFDNTRVLADHFAKDVGATVFVPDFYDGEIIPKEILMDPEKRKGFDLAGWAARHSKEKRSPTIFKAARALKQDLKFKKVGAVGYCYGGWAVFQLGAKGKINVDLVDAISTAHPSVLTPSEISAVAVPTQILAPEHDPQFTPELRDKANTIILTLGVEYDFQFFPGLAHGFAVRGDREDRRQREGLERGMRAVGGWMKEILRRD